MNLEISEPNGTTEIIPDEKRALNWIKRLLRNSVIYSPGLIKSFAFLNLWTDRYHKFTNIEAKNKSKHKVV